MAFPVLLILLILGGTTMFVLPNLPEPISKPYNIWVTDVITNRAVPFGSIILIGIVILLLIFWR